MAEEVARGGHVKDLVAVQVAFDREADPVCEIANVDIGPVRRLGRTPPADVRTEVALIRLPCLNPARAKRDYTRLSSARAPM